MKSDAPNLRSSHKAGGLYAAELAAIHAAEDWDEKIDARFDMLCAMLKREVLAEGEPFEFDMDVWLEEPAEHERCGTAACIGGAAYICSILEREGVFNGHDGDAVIQSVASQWLRRRGGAGPNYRLGDLFNPDMAYNALHRKPLASDAIAALRRVQRDQDPWPEELSSEGG